MTTWISDELARVGTSEELQMAGHGIDDEIDPAYASKYRYAPSIIRHITSPARSTTIRLVPRSTTS